MFTEFDRQCMQRALVLAQQASLQDEVPIGAVLAKEEQIIAEGFNQPRASCDPTAHAEIIALRQGAQQLHNYRLIDTTLYVTLEPCAMCAGALVHARVNRLVYAASEPKAGGCGSVLNVAHHPQLNHRIECQSGLFGEKAKQLLQAFFVARRRIQGRT